MIFGLILIAGSLLYIVVVGDQPTLNDLTLFQTQLEYFATQVPQDPFDIYKAIDFVEESFGEKFSQPLGKKAPSDITLIQQYTQYQMQFYKSLMPTAKEQAINYWSTFYTYDTIQLHILKKEAIPTVHEIANLFIENKRSIKKAAEQTINAAATGIENPVPAYSGYFRNPMLASFTVGLLGVGFIGLHILYKLAENAN